MELAKETVEICERGNYQSLDGAEIEIGNSIRACLESTRFYQPDELKELTRKVLTQSSSAGFETRIEVVNETAISGIARLMKDVVAPIAALNFASAKNPGGRILEWQSRSRRIVGEKFCTVSIVAASEDVLRATSSVAVTALF